MTVSRSPLMSNKSQGQRDNVTGGDEEEEEADMDDVKDVFEATPIQHICLLCHSSGETVQMSQAEFCDSCGLNLCPSCNECSFCQAQWTE